MLVWRLHVPATRPGARRESRAGSSPVPQSGEQPAPEARRVDLWRAGGRVPPLPAAVSGSPGWGLAAVASDAGAQRLARPASAGAAARPCPGENPEERCAGLGRAPGGEPRGGGRGMAGRFARRHSAAVPLSKVAAGHGPASSAARSRPWGWEDDVVGLRQSRLNLRRRCGVPRLERNFK